MQLCFACCKEGTGIEDASPALPSRGVAGWMEKKSSKEAPTVCKHFSDHRDAKSFICYQENWGNM